MNWKTLLAIGASCAVLAACGGGGGGGDSGPVNSGGVPNSAQTSVAGLIAYMQQLIAGTNDSDAPVSLDNVTLPVDDGAQPSPI